MSKEEQEVIKLEKYLDKKAKVISSNTLYWFLVRWARELVKR